MPMWPSVLNDYWIRRLLGGDSWESSWWTDEWISRDHQLALSPFTHIFRSHYDQGTKCRLFDLVEQKRKSMNIFCHFCWTSESAPTSCHVERTQPLFVECEALHSQTHPHRHKCARQVRRSLSYESSLSANPWRKSMKDTYKQELTDFQTSEQE